MRARTVATAAFATALVLAACGDDDDDAGGGATTTGVASSAPDTSAAPVAPTDAGSTDVSAPTPDSGDGTAGSGVVDTAGSAVVEAGAPFPEERCAENEAAGTITYLSGFDFAATASIIDVVLADEAGYYEDLCLDVELQPSFSTANYPILASGDAQVASGGNFSELLNYAAANEADLVAIAVEGRSAIDSLILKPGTATELSALEGTTIGVKGAIPPSVAAMLATAGLAEGEDYETVLLDGFDPLTHITLEGIVGFPGYKSNEPGQLERAGVPFDLFDPTEYGIPGSFGVLLTNRAFMEEHPTAVEDFLRATMKGLQDALADPEGAAATALARIEEGGNPNFLSPEGEMFRWQTDAALLTSEAPAGTGLAIPDAALLQAEVDAYEEVGLFGEGGAPDIAERFDVDAISSVYDGEQVIWPG
jgi:ABC-type nitrate/sulfonate/bicarbonate transport system substrate-binding protein